MNSKDNIGIIHRAPTIQHIQTKKLVCTNASLKVVSKKPTKIGLQNI
jgi:hypothetical protein